MIMAFTPFITTIVTGYSGGYGNETSPWLPLLPLLPFVFVPLFRCSTDSITNNNGTTWNTSTKLLY
jgi:hypothetical protein